MTCDKKHFIYWRNIYIIAIFVDIPGSSAGTSGASGREGISILSPPSSQLSSSPSATTYGNTWTHQHISDTVFEWQKETSKTWNMYLHNYDLYIQIFTIIIFGHTLYESSGFVSLTSLNRLIIPRLQIRGKFSPFNQFMGFFQAICNHIITSIS